MCPNCLCRGKHPLPAKRSSSINEQYLNKCTINGDIQINVNNHLSVFVLATCIIGCNRLMKSIHHTLTTWTNPNPMGGLQIKTKSDQPCCGFLLQVTDSSCNKKGYDISQTFPCGSIEDKNTFKPSFLYIDTTELSYNSSNKVNVLAYSSAATSAVFSLLHVTQAYRQQVNTEVCQTTSLAFPNHCKPQPLGVYCFQLFWLTATIICVEDTLDPGFPQSVFNKIINSRPQ